MRRRIIAALLALAFAPSCATIVDHDQAVEVGKQVRKRSEATGRRSR